MVEPIPKETQLRGELEKRAFHKGEGQFSQIEYCDFCSYSRDWIEIYGHGDDCLLKVLP